MSFVWFRKYEKLFLWGTVVFSVVLLATFSGFGSLRVLLQRAGSEHLMGEFTVASTGQTMRVDTEEYQRVRTALNRLSYSRGQRDNVTEDDIWAHIMLAADAHGAGMDISDAELTRVLSGGKAMTKEDYRHYWRDILQFPSAHEFENFVRDILISQRWTEIQADEARIVSADDVYLRWRADNEVFDFEALVFPDEPVDKIEDPDAATLQAYWDGMPEPLRTSKFVDPVKQDIVYAWLPMAGGADKVPADKLAAIAEPDPTAVEARFHQVQADRWPDKKDLDDEARGALARELKLVKYVEDTLTAFQALPAQTAETFSKTMGDAGLTVVNPEGQLGPDEIKALPDIGDENLPLFLSRKAAGDTHFGYPYANQKTIYAVYVESVKPSRPLSYDEAHDQLVKAWKEEQRGRAAKAFREDITKQARELPEAAAAIAPILEAAKLRAEQQVAAKPDLDDAGKEALRKQVMDDADQNEVQPRLEEFESKVWANITPPPGVTRLGVSGVRRSYNRKPDPAQEAPGSIERFLKTNTAVFQLAVNAISQPLHHAATNKTAIVRILGRSFPSMQEMLADRDSMEASRKLLASQRQFEAGQGFTAEALKLSHKLKVVENPKQIPLHAPDDGE